MSARYELVVIGAGTAGFTATQTALAEGRRLLLVSGPGALGGTCILRGCMPAKTLLASTEMLGEVEKAAHVGVEADAVHVDVPAIVARKRELIDYFRRDRVDDLEALPLVRGAARFVARDAVEVEGRRITADRFIIATGSHIVPPPISGLREAGFITSEDVFEMTRPPRAVAVLGGGPVGCEFAQYFARLGSRVTLLQDGPELLRNEDPDVGRAVRRVLEREGVTVACDAQVERCTAAGDERVVTYASGEVTASVHVEAIMLAMGRTPNLANLQLACAGVLADERTIAVDPYLRTTNRSILAAGDVIGRRCLVHVAAYAGKLAARNAFAGTPEQADFDRYEAHAVYTQPQVAVAGLTERECRARGMAVRVRRHPFDEIGKALVSDEAQGFVKMIAAPDGRIAGVAIVGDDAVDLIGEAIALIDRGATVADVAAMPHLHPTMGEIFGRVAEDLAA